MDLIADRGRRVTVEELNTSRLLAHARKQRECWEALECGETSGAPHRRPPEQEQ